jgi:hypothetical protein
MPDGLPGLAAQHRLHRSYVVPPRLHRGDELGHQLLPLPRLQLLDAPEHLGLETFHVQVRPQGFFGGPHLKLCPAEVALQELHDVLWFLPEPLHCRHIWQSLACGGRA